MRPFHLILSYEGGEAPRRIDFHADGPDHAFQIARNEADGVHVELWEGSTLLARMTKSGANIWKLLPTTRGAGKADEQSMPSSAVAI